MLPVCRSATASGGPAEFFIDGFAGGFGINSSVAIPRIQEIRNFIMVKSAFGEPYFEGDNQSSNLSRAFESFPPTPDQYWIAIGIKANHYKFVNPSSRPLSLLATA
ncbi:MAG: DUF6603 domain-containing protein [Saprospiraceae bacterium]